MNILHGCLSACPHSGPMRSSITVSGERGGGGAFGGLILPCPSGLLRRVRVLLRHLRQACLQVGSEVDIVFTSTYQPCPGTLHTLIGDIPFWAQPYRGVLPRFERSLILGHSCYDILFPGSQETHSWRSHAPGSECLARLTGPGHIPGSTRLPERGGGRCFYPRLPMRCTAYPRVMLSLWNFSHFIVSSYCLCLDPCCPCLTSGSYYSTRSQQ